MIKQAEKEYAPLEVEKQVQAFWQRAKVYPKTVAAREKGEDFYFVDGPPYTTGAIHIGQVLNKTVKDMVVRWRRMQGYHVRDQAGFDMHGLPTEVQVEKTLGITNKREIEELGIERFVTACREFSLDQLRKMTASFQQLGVWLDWERPYMTIANEYIEGAWWTFKRAHERGLVYEALRSIQWCSRCETALADAEVEYADETDPSVYVKFPLKDRPDEALLVWTTTPWTIPANLAIAAHPAFTYAKVKMTRGGRTEYLWMLDSTVEPVMKLTQATHEVVETRTGDKLAGLEYTHPLAGKVPYQATVTGEWVHKVVTSENVEAERTGLVHSAPGHGPEDFELGQRLGLPVFSPVDEHGRFTSEAGAYQGRHVKEANPLILEDLRAVHALYVEETLVHSYGHCWRCKTPVLFRATVQWFVRATDVKARMLEEVHRVKWYPDWAGSARQANWTEGLRDWCISRQRYWGAPLPIWRCAKCSEWIVIGSAAELRGARGYSEGMDLHRPWIDGVVLPCPKCRGDMARVKDIDDVWFESGVASWASLGYPAHEEEFRRWWPARWIVEGPDQTRGWFASQLATGVIAFDRAPYESVLMHGWVNGPDGRQMHKSLGNYIEADVMMGKYGVDPLRLYVLLVNAPWEDITFQEEGIRTAQRTLNVLWNVLRFATTYMALDRFDPGHDSLDSLHDHLRPEDRWLLSRLESVKATFAKEMETYQLHRGYRAVDGFVLNDLSRWYVKLVRDRTWMESASKDKLAVYHVLYRALSTLAALLAPATPHIAEAVYQRLGGSRLSVHMEDWPRGEPTWANASLEDDMAVAQELVEVVSKERQKGGRKLRWPVRLVAVKGASPGATKALASLRSVFLDQANAKDLVLIKPDEDFPGITLVAKPDPAAIGKAYKALLPKVQSLLASRPADEIKKALDQGGYDLRVDGQTVTIRPGMVAFDRKMPQDVASVSTPHGELILDLRVTPEIRTEAYAREVIRRVQQMRKDIDLDVDDYLVTVMKPTKELAAAVESMKEVVAQETRSRTLTLTEGKVDAEHVVEWKDVDGQSVTIGITPLHVSETLRVFVQDLGLTPAQALHLFDAGYKGLGALRSASKGELAAIEGLTPADLERVLKAVTSPPSAPVPCPFCDAPLPKGARRCPRCGESTGRGSAGTRRKSAAAPMKAVPPAPQPAHAAKETLEAASTYLVEGAGSERAYGLFLDAVRTDRRGLCVTRLYPQKLRERLNAPEIPVLWLSNVGKEDAVRPQDLERLSRSLEDFLSRGPACVLIDGIEYLVTNNNFLTVLRFVQSMRDQTAIHHGILLLSVEPSTLEAQQLTLLEREVDRVVRAPTPT